MSSHSGTIGRKRGGSSGGSEYYFGVGSLSGEANDVVGGQRLMRRQRSAEWHSRHGYSSSEDEYQNTGQTSAFDTQLLATLLLQSQQLANMERYNSDAENEEVTTSLLTEYPKPNRDHHNLAAQYYQSKHMQSTNLCGSPHKTASSNTLGAAAGLTSANNVSKYQTSASLGLSIPLATRSTNPFLNSKYDSQSNSDSLSERLSYSGSAVMLDRLQISTAAAELSASTSTGGGGGGAYLMPTSSAMTSGAGISSSTTASSLQNPSVGRDNSLRTSRSKNGRLSRTSGMTSSSSGTSSNGNAAVATSSAAAVASAVAAALANRSEREKIKLQQIQMELREFAQCDGTAAAVTVASSSMVKFGDADDDEPVHSAGESEPPPEPAPPEIPPRTQSLLMSLRKDFKLKYEEKERDQKHEEFIPTSQLQQMQQQLQRDYLIADNSRSSESQSKSIASSDSPSQQGIEDE